MNLHDRRIKIIAAVLAVLILIIGVRIFMNVMSAKEKAEKAKQGKVVTIATELAKKGTIYPVLSFAGNLDPVWQAKIAPKLAGRIQNILVNEGDYVESGRILAILESSEISATTSALRGSVYDAKASFEQAETTLSRNLSQYPFPR